MKCRPALSGGMGPGRPWAGALGCGHSSSPVTRTTRFSRFESEGPLMNLDLRALIGKLNHETKGAVEAAAGLCLSRTHYDVEVEHYLMKLLDQTDGDLAFILKHYGADRSRLAAELTRSLD